MQECRSQREGVFRLCIFKQTKIINGSPAPVYKGLEAIECLHIFYKWYKDTRNKIVEVKVDGLPTSDQEESKKESPSQEPSSIAMKPSCVRILVELRMTNGLHISQKNLSYQELKRLIEKLEGLC